MPRRSSSVSRAGRTQQRPKLNVPDLETFARARGFARRGGEVDLHNAAGAYLKDFNDGKLGRITFEQPEND